jgi:hypothetical protein
MTPSEKILHSWLSQACALLGVEARDHDENRYWDSPKQRKEIAKTIRSFIVAANKVLDNLKEDAA